MARSLPQWIGKTDDTAVPERVQMRIFDLKSGTCWGCGRPLRAEPWTCDHIDALINGGENRESNLQALGNKCCNPDKNAADVREKSLIYRKRKKHIGLRKSKWRPMPGTKASGIRKRMSGAVERWD